LHVVAFQKVSFIKICGVKIKTIPFFSEIQLTFALTCLHTDTIKNAPNTSAALYTTDASPAWGRMAPAGSSTSGPCSG
jgi:hypothetical protein